jgi:low temperature requirement protein LtrA
VINGGLQVAAMGGAAFLLVVVWWAWIYTTWMVNWFDPRSVVVRVVLLGVALASRLMSASVPTALTGHAAFFAGAHVALQVGRNLAGRLCCAAASRCGPCSSWSWCGAARRGSCG